MKGARYFAKISPAKTISNNGVRRGRKSKVPSVSGTDTDPRRSCSRHLFEPDRGLPLECNSAREAQQCGDRIEQAPTEDVSNVRTRFCINCSEAK